MRVFNTTGKCIPSIHYMVDISRQVEAAAKLVRFGSYFCINRGRQYGKTTTLSLLKTKLEAEGYTVFSFSFEGLGDSTFASVETLLHYTLLLMKDTLDFDEVRNIDDAGRTLIGQTPEKAGNMTSRDYCRIIWQLCKTNRVVVLVDEVDQAGNHASFVQFLGVLRDMYLKRDTRPTFRSVVLAGVYDIKNLKFKIRPEYQHQYNSPWNIAASFDEDMALQIDGIADMLRDYQAEHGIKFDEQFVAQFIYSYTSGYPFLVSRLCQIVDENSLSWDKEGVLKAVNGIIKESNTLFDDLNRKLEQFPEMKKLLSNILYLGEKKSYSPDELYTELARRFNFLTEYDGIIRISCRLIETRLYNLLLAEEDTERMYTSGQMDKNQFVHDGIIDMRHLLERFCVHFNDIFRTDGDSMDMEFVEKQGRKQFLLYIRPIINGVGNYYVEAETRDETRTDVVIDYMGRQYVIELKIWHGDSYNKRGENQLMEYLDYYHQKKGYLVSFCFNKGKTPGVHDVNFKDYEIIEAVV